MRIDAHQHYWKLERGDYSWLGPDNKTLYRDFMPADLSSMLEECRIQKTVIIQAAPTVQETKFLLDIAQSEPTAAGVVGWLDFNLDSRTFEKNFLDLNMNHYLVGLRLMIHDIPDDRWILKDQVLENIGILQKYRFPIDLLIYPRHLPYIQQLLQLYPNLSAVVDHIGKPNLQKGIKEPWATFIREISAYPNIMCKLSGMVTEADHSNWSVRDLRPHVEFVMENFGVERVMYGSDWPVCTMAATYKQVYNSLLDALSEIKHVAEPDINNIFGANAEKFYSLRGP